MAYFLIAFCILWVSISIYIRHKKNGILKDLSFPSIPQRHLFFRIASGANKNYCVCVRATYNASIGEYTISATELKAAEMKVRNLDDPVKG